MKMTIVDPSGIAFPFDGSQGVWLGKEWDGLIAPPFELESDPAVGRQGAVLRRVRVEQRDVEIPILVSATSEAGLRTKVRELMAATNPRRGDGRLRLAYEDGTSRDLIGRVAEVVGEGADRHGSKQLARLVWRAFDPYWRADEIVREYQVAAPDFFDDPDGFPLQLAGATIIATVSEDNQGDADAWPVWTIRGPGIPRLENETTGETVDFDGLTLAAGEVLEVDTEPGVKTVTLDGDNIYDQLTLSSSLFALAPGVNVLNVDLEDGTEDSLVRLRYRPRTLAP